MLRAERKAKEVSQVQIAAKLRNRQTFISKIEVGNRRLDVIEMLEYLHAIGSDPSEFIARRATRVKGLTHKDTKLAIRRTTKRAPRKCLNPTK
jgi:transcriptional regulator with XRE-family HTH domain